MCLGRLNAHAIDHGEVVLVGREDIRREARKLQRHRLTDKQRGTHEDRQLTGDTSAQHRRTDRQAP
eukprot:1079828-Alexandrium_andersonii.AAC.1